MYNIDPRAHTNHGHSIYIYKKSTHNAVCLPLIIKIVPRRQKAAPASPHVCHGPGSQHSLATLPPVSPSGARARRYSLCLRRAQSFSAVAQSVSEVSPALWSSGPSTVTTRLQWREDIRTSVQRTEPSQFS